MQRIMSMLEWNAAEWHTGSSPSCTYIIVFFFFLKRHNLVLRVLDADFFYFYEKSCGNAFRYGNAFVAFFC